MTRTNWREFDWLLVVLVISLIAIGIVMVTSITKSSESLTGYGERQAIFALIGLFFFILAAIIDYHVWESLGWFLYAFLLVGLAIVVTVGKIQGGAQRWLTIGGVALQPSEPAKLLVILFFAHFLGQSKEYIKKFGGVVVAFILLISPLVLIYRQPDLGTAISVAFAVIVMIFIAGAHWLHLGIFGGLGLLTLPFVWMHLAGYMQERVLSFLHPESDPKASYHIHQALISVGSGGWLGQGLGHGSQSSLHFLPVRHTDFIFSVIAEELGLVGAFLVLLLLALLIFHLWQIAQKAPDRTGMLLVTGIAALIFFQVIVNVSMNLGLMPVTGIPLPFISYGGSSLISFLTAVGVVESVCIHQRRPAFD